MKRKYTQITVITGIITTLLFCAPSGQAATNVQTWTSESTFEGPRHTGSSTAIGTVTRTGEGSSWEADRQGIVDGDKKWESTTTGSGSKTADGYEKSSTTKGTTESGKDWTTTREVEAVKNADGTMIINRDATKTLEDGKTITRDSQTVVTKTEDGKTWETTGTRTGPKGTATMKGSGSAVKSDEGVSVNINRQGTTAAGKTWDSTTTGSGTKTDTGRKWNSTTVGSTEGGKTWKATRECEANKSGANATVQRKTAVKTQPAAKSPKTAKSGFFGKFKKSSAKPAAN